MVTSFDFRVNSRVSRATLSVEMKSVVPLREQPVRKDFPPAAARALHSIFADRRCFIGPGTSGRDVFFPRGDPWSPGEKNDEHQKANENGGDSRRNRHVGNGFVVVFVDFDAEMRRD